MPSSAANLEESQHAGDAPQLLSIRGHHILADLIDRDSVVVDLGAHFGQFSSAMTVRFGCRCYAVEPNPSLWNKIPEIDRIQRFNLAIAGTTGHAMFKITDNLECSHLSGGAGGSTSGAELAVQTATLSDFVKGQGIERIDVLKVDIEGAEFEMFDSLSDEFLRSIGQITTEFHDFIPELSCDVGVARVKARLKRLGFACTVFSRGNNGDVLFINRAVYKGTPLQWFYLERLARYTQGLVRIADRWLHPITASAGS